MAQIYKTNQRKIILDFLSASGGKHLTAAGVFAALRDSGHEVGRATVYRYLDKLTADGALRRYASPDGGGALYEYCGCDGHFHLKCDVCGRLLHLECGDVPALFSHIEEKHDFRIDQARTVFHGTCGKCGKREGTKD